MARASFEHGGDASARAQIVFLYEGLSQSEARRCRAAVLARSAAAVFRDCRKERI
jgi:hypothetical protein